MFQVPMLSALVNNLGNYRIGKIYRGFNQNRYLSNSNSHCLSKMEGDKVQEKDEPKQPPIGSSNSKFEKAEKTVEYFNRARTSLDSILQLFEEHKDDHAQIPILLETYKDIRERYLEKVDHKKNYPLIVFEGLDGSGKSSICKRFANKVGAEIMPTPPKSIASFREKFDGHFCWHSPFYYFGNYLAALEVAEALKTKPVVMDRFWHSTTAFALAQMEEDYYNVMKSTGLPEKGSNTYEWPEDLLKPDIVIFLDVSENVRIQRLSKRVSKTGQEKLLEAKQEFRRSVLSAYENMENPGICKVNGNLTPKYVLQQVEAQVKDFFLNYMNAR